MRALYRKSARRYVLDANALTGYFEDREGTAGKVGRLLADALSQELPLLMSAVNWGEVFYVMSRYHGEQAAREVEANLQEMPLTIIDADQVRASRAGAIKQKHGLGYADAFAAELTMEQKAWLVTADPGFEKMGKVLSVYSLPRYEK